MKKLISLIIIVVFAGVGFGIAKLTTQDSGIISVSASTEAEIAPDTVEINIEVKTSDKEALAKAAKENKEITDKIYNMLQNMISENNKDYIKTANYNARVVYVYDHELKRQVMDKYEVSNQIIVHTKNIANLGKIIDNAIELGATNINDLMFSVSNYENKCLDLLDKAAKKAYTKAQAVANASFTQIKGIQTININCSENSVQPVPYRVMAKGLMMANVAANEAVADSSTPISSGNLKIFANVNASYYLK